MKIEVYTDGSCLGNPGPGGYGIVLIKEDGEVEKMIGNHANTTNNRMELLAMCLALNHILDFYNKPSNTIKIHSDSSYVINAINKKWIEGWILKGWKTSKGGSVKNEDLWKRLIEIRKKLKVDIEYVWVKGHAGNKYNEMVDVLAREEARKAEEANKEWEEALWM